MSGNNSQEQLLAAERKDLEQWQPLVRKLSALGFGPEDIHSNLLQRGLCEADATLLVTKNERETRPPSAEDLEAAKANAGCMASWIILAICLLYILYGIGSVIP